MKIFASSILLGLVAAGSAEKSGYGQPQQAPSSYQAYPSGYTNHPPPQNYGYSPFPPQNYKKHGEYEDYVEMVVPPAEKPDPFIEFPVDEMRKLSLPHLGEYHCFLTGAPWTKCGRRSLTSYFLDQCMVFHYMMSANVDGICGGEAPKTEAFGEKYKYMVYGDQHGYNEYGGYPQGANNYGYNSPAAGSGGYYQPPASASKGYMSDEKSAQQDAPAPKMYEETPAPSEPASGYGDASLKTYQKERCLQRTYVSVTAATLMCLTENLIRIKYIEHYAKDASQNPIEGPMLYLKKLHTFIKNVLGCTGKDAAKNYPNLWLEWYNSEGFLTYNPNSPFVIDPATKEVTTDQYTNAEAVGLKDYIVDDDKILCANVKHIRDEGRDERPRGIYNLDEVNPHYSYGSINSCSSSQAKKHMGTFRTDQKKVSRVYKVCNYVRHNVHISSRDGPVGPKGHRNDPGQQYLADLNGRGLYDAMIPSTYATTSTFRSRTIAEIAVHAGLHGQPLLDGFGIMYFCAFYACKANNGGNLDGTCFPKFDCDSDWDIPSSITSMEKLNELSSEVKECLNHKFIISTDVSESEAVRSFKKSLDRSFICMAEENIVDFFDYVFRTSSLPTDTAWDLVYFRHLSVERCYLESEEACPSQRQLYRRLVDALESIVDTCETNKAKYYAQKQMGYYGYGQPAYAQNGYHHIQPLHSRLKYPWIVISDLYVMFLVSLTPSVLGCISTLSFWVQLEHFITLGSLHVKRLTATVFTILIHPT